MRKSYIESIGREEARTELRTPSQIQPKHSPDISHKQIMSPYIQGDSSSSSSGASTPPAVVQVDDTSKYEPIAIVGMGMSFHFKEFTWCWSVEVR